MAYFDMEWLIRISASILIGLLIGYERHSKAKEAGIRTHIIVAMTSCILMILSQNGFVNAEKVDVSRIAASVVSGIGFLGAGMIFVQRGSIQGLTTAAGMWATAALGLCLGAGMYVVGFFGAILIFLVEMFLPKLFPYAYPRSILKIRVHIKSDATAKIVNECLGKLHYNHSENYISSDQSGGYYVETEIMTHKDADPKLIIDEFKKNDQVIEIEIL